MVYLLHVLRPLPPLLDLPLCPNGAEDPDEGLQHKKGLGGDLVELVVHRVEDGGNQHWSVGEEGGGGGGRGAMGPVQKWTINSHLT